MKESVINCQTIRKSGQENWPVVLAQHWQSYLTDTAIEVGIQYAVDFSYPVVMQPLTRVFQEHHCLWPKDSMKMPQWPWTGVTNVLYVRTVY